jgi:NarL family two-component system response regulator LiaR
LGKFCIAVILLILISIYGNSSNLAIAKTGVEVAMQKDVNKTLIRIVIADDHKVVRVGLEAFLALDPQLEIVGLASTGEEALALVAKLEPDILLLDLVMPGKDGFAVLEALSINNKDLESYRKVKVLVFTNALDRGVIVRALKMGAKGYLAKDVDAEELCAVIKNAVRINQLLISPQVANLLATEPISSADDLARPLLPVIPVSVINISKLSQRELEILELLGEGITNKEIALRLHLSEGTVKAHISVVLTKLGIRSRIQAALFANRNNQRQNG